MNFFIYNYANIKMCYEAEGRECKTLQKALICDHL